MPGISRNPFERFLKTLEGCCMNPESSLRGRWLRYALSISFLSLFAVVFLGDASGANKAKRKTKAAAKMVEDIVSRNKPPKIVDLPDEWPRKVPRFPKS